MSLDQQVALARSSRGESSHLSKAARQVVPPFLQKLYEIVSDPRNDELIRWSENGDSFYVLNHERFAREVLGRWFKHQKFTSFVRQLNMYGFHKIPHLQQGVLKSDTDTEPWNFEHPHFHRGQPDLLCLIQRKKQPAHGVGDDDAVDSLNPANPLSLPGGPVLDVNSVLNGIQAIKRHQQAISAELNALKKSNDILWEEAAQARRRHDKHQDTINRILKFLAGVFGSSADGVHKADGPHTPTAVVPRAHQRLMIADAARSKAKTVEIADADDDDDGSHRVQPQERHGSPFRIEQFASIDTPDSSVFSPTLAAQAPFSPTADSNRHTSVRPSEVLNRNSSGSSDNVRSSASTPTGHSARGNDVPQRHSDSALSPAALTALAAASGAGGNNEIWQAAIQQVLNTPGQLQRLMQALANTQQQPFPLTHPSDSNPSPRPAQHGQIAPYDSNGFDYNGDRFRQDIPVGASTSPVAMPLLSDSGPALEPLMDNMQRLQKTYQTAAEIEADMDVLQHSINSLIENLGMDPLALQQAENSIAAARVASAMGAAGSANGYGLPSVNTGLSGPDSSMLPPLDAPQDTSGDFFLDALLNGDPGIDYADMTDRFDPATHIDGAGTRVADASTDQLTAFLDEVSDASTVIGNGSGSGTNGTPSTMRSPDVKSVAPGAPAAGQKRKSELELPPLPAQTTLELPPGVPKAKRKR
ncbi:hypothetical protein OBBRIDRAFT_789905 [Obba rivulosa]|uniref:HSF-type DNA-binding domain-containing protein n=1 Tax=Obba rivulosa TaxID=1052685 RepID=A0A8E2DQK4_9APHY|nr:hypothetical protein OBBRIDRAFT_789905 [Obba rivulosa]